MRELLGRIAAWDTRLSLALQARRGRVSNGVFAAFSWSGAGGVWFALALLLVVTHRHGVELIAQQQRFVVAMVAALAVLLLGSVLKSLTRRTRPYASGQGITAAIWAPGPRRSFPSTHAATAVALATALFKVGHPLAAPVALWAAAVAVSRVWLGVHYASDVVAGVALGVLSGLLPWAEWHG